MMTSTKHFSLLQWLSIAFVIAVMLTSSAVFANPFEELKNRLEQELQYQQEQLRNQLSPQNPQQNLDNQVQLTELVIVPSLTGMPPAQAAAILADRGLVLGKVEDIVANQTPGIIVAQVPAANSQLPAQQRVDVMVSKGGGEGRPTPTELPPTEILAAVPNVKGMTLNQAKAALTDANLRLGDVVQKPAQQEKATVLDQHPLAGQKLQPRSTVDLIVADPQKPAKPPEATPEPLKLVLTVERNRLNKGEAIQLKIDTSFQRDGMEYSFNIAGKAHKSKTPTIRHQFNEAGRFPITASARLPRQAWVHSKSQWVEVIDSEKPTDAIVRVPDVTGQSLQNAIKTLQEAGLRVGTLSQKEARTLEGILEQSPAAGSEVDKGTAIDLVEAIESNADESKFDLALAANKETLDEKEEAAFQALLSPMPEQGQARYRYFINGEGHASSGNNWSHQFDKRGQYQITAEALLDGEVIARSNTISITVDSYWQEPKAIIKPASLVVTQGDTAVFESQSTHDASTSIKAVWTDETGRNSRGDTHSIDTEKLAPGEYWISLRVKDKRGFENVARAYLIVAEVDNGTINAGGTDIIEETTQSTSDQNLPTQVQLELLASAKHILSGSKVRFSIVQFPAHSDSSMVRYHIVYGDGNHAEISQPWIEYEYSSGGIYQAYVTTQSANGLVQSQKVGVWVWPMWLLIGLFITVMALIWRLLSPIFRLGKKSNKPSAKKNVVEKKSSPDVAYKAEKDAGEQQLKAERQESASKRQEPSFDVAIESKSDAGTQVVIHDKKDD